MNLTEEEIEQIDDENLRDFKLKCKFIISLSLLTIAGIILSIELTNSDKVGYTWLIIPIAFLIRLIFDYPKKWDKMTNLERDRTLRQLGYI